MKRIRLFALFTWVLMLAASNAFALPTLQTTAFTYQGQLNAGGVLPSGQIFQFTFTLYDAVTAGNVVGTPVSQAILIGNGGLFTADLDFGQIFNGTQYWLEVKVGTTVGNEQALTSRQRINAAPVAQYALNTPPGDFADFYALMPPNNPVPVSLGTDVQFPQDGPTSGTGVIVRTSATTFTLSAIGTYQVMFQVSVNEAGQLVLAANGTELPYTVVGRSTGASQIVGTALITTSVANTVLSVRNPAAGIVALTITPNAGNGSNPVSAHLLITRLH
jgi:hypothetical protein